MNNSNKIFVFHLLNDRSGSPKVLSQILQNWVLNGRSVHLYTSLHLDGFLSNIKGVHYYNGWYRFKLNPWIRLCYFAISQVILFVKMLSKVKKNDTVYINTMLPFGAAILGKLKGCRVIYHVHESSISPKILKWFLLKILKWSATDIINVSSYVEKSHGIFQSRNHLVHNAIDSEFLANRTHKHATSLPQNVLMVCSLKAYKGIFEFVELAANLPQFDFKLVLNADSLQISEFFKHTAFTNNITLFTTQNNLHPFYNWAHVVVNLSKPDAWIETFGLTILEGMAYGLPAIVPPVGGVLEVVEVGVTGYSVDSSNKAELVKTLENLLTDTLKYHAFSNASLIRVNNFNEKTLFDKINLVVFNAV